MRDLPGKELARELMAASRGEARATPMEAVIAAAGNGHLDAAATHRLIGRLWALERMFYYIYGGWGQGLEMNDFPPSVKYLFSNQIVENRSHINMGRRIVEEFISKPVDADLARWAIGIAKRDYRRYLQEVADIVLDRPLTAPAPPRVRVLD